MATRAPRRRLDRLRDHLETRGWGGALVSRPEHLRYLTGLALTLPAFLLVTRGAAVLVAPGDAAGDDALADLGVARERYVAYEAGRLVDRSLAATAALGRVARALAVRDPVALEVHHTPVAVLGALGAAAPVDLAPALAHWRSVKDPEEVAAIRHRVDLLDRALAVARDAIRPGLSEQQLHEVVRASLVPELEEPVVLSSNVASGPRTALPSPRHTARRMEPGDLVLLDLYPVLDGYVADLTRTFVVGEPTPLQEARHGVLVAALAAAEARLRPGLEAALVDRRIREVLAEAGGYDRTMDHHSGHGLGLFPWEAPWIGASAEGGLAAGQVVALEPGLYVPGWGGMRLERNYLITEGGAEGLDRFPAELVVVGA